MDKTPIMARTANISIMLRPEGEGTRRAARPKNFGAAGEKRKYPLQFDCSERPFCLPHRRGERARLGAPPICKGTARPNFFDAAGERPERWTPVSGEPVIENRTTSRNPFSNRVFIFLKRLKNAAKRLLSLFWGGGGIVRINKLRHGKLLSFFFLFL